MRTFLVEFKEYAFAVPEPVTVRRGLRVPVAVEGMVQRDGTGLGPFLVQFVVETMHFRVSGASYTKTRA